MMDFIITERKKGHLACLKQKAVGWIYDAYFSPNVSMYIFWLLRNMLSRIYGHNHFMTRKCHEFQGQRDEK
jgi:hypothetical protein